MAEVFIKAECSHCESVNWCNMGDPIDITRFDCDGLECWNCEKEFLFSEENRDMPNPFFDVGEKYAK